MATTDTGRGTNAVRRAAVDGARRIATSSDGRADGAHPARRRRSAIRGSRASHGVRLLAAGASLVASLSSLSSLATAAPIDIVDDRGVHVVLDQPPRRIVSLLPSVTESVCVLGACDRLVGTDRYSNAPASVLALPKLGGLDDAQIERIVALKPDVVLAAQAARVTERLESLGVKVVRLGSQTHADVRHSLATIARLLGTPAEAERVWAGIEQQLAAAAVRVPPAIRGSKVYFEIGAGPYAAGAGSFIGETLAALGLGNAVPAAFGPFPRLNPEFVVRADPDIVMAGRRALDAMRERPGWERLDALAHGRACGFDAAQYELLIRPGPRLGEAAAVLADCLATLPARPGS